MIATNIGRYQIIEQIGRGGMAKVYKAYDPHFERQVAIKVMTMELIDDPKQRSRFKREAKTIAALEHPAIVPVYDYGEENNRPYIVMRLIRGGTLAMRLQKGPIPVDETVRIIERISSALDRAHAKGIVHRDLKPTNIMFDDYNEAYLADFGIARLTENTLTLTGDAVIGTPAYMSPEQIHGDRDVDCRSDIYSLGVICFEMMTGEKPYDNATSTKLMMSHVLDPVPNIREVNPDLPDGMDEFISRTMAKQPEERFASAGEVASTLVSITNRATGPVVKDGEAVATATAEQLATDSVKPADEAIAEPPGDGPAEHPDTEVMPPSFVGRSPAAAAGETEAITPEFAKAMPDDKASKGKRTGMIVGGIVGILVVIILAAAIIGGIVGGILGGNESDQASPAVGITPGQADQAIIAAAETDDALALVAETEATETALAEEAQQEVAAAAEAKAAQDGTSTAEALATKVSEEEATSEAAAQATEEAQEVATAEARATAMVQEKMLAIVAAARTEDPVFGAQAGAMAHNDDDLIEFVSANISVRDFLAEATFITDREGSEAGNRDYGFYMRIGDADFYRLTVISSGYWELGITGQNWEYTQIRDGYLNNLNTDGTANELIVYAKGENGLFFVNGEFVGELDLSAAQSRGDVEIFTGAYVGDETPGQETGYRDFAVWSLDKAEPEDDVTPLPAPSESPDQPAPAAQEYNLGQAIADVRTGIESFGGNIDIAVGTGTIYCDELIYDHDWVVSAPTFDALDSGAVQLYRSALATFADGSRDISQNCREYLADPDQSGGIPFQQWGLARQRVNDALELLSQAERALGQ